MDLKVSEIFESIQGEGPNAGAPAMFLRLAHCNLRCVWCDTKYTWDFDQYRYDDEVTVETSSALARRIRQSGARRLIVTGGEPLLQKEALEHLVAPLDRALAIEVETNGTIAPTESLATRIDQWNVSPKLTNSEEEEGRRIREPALAALAATGRAYLKLVVVNESDVAEAKALVDRLDWPPDRVLLMPQARTPAELRERGPTVARLCIDANLRFSPRLHLQLFDGRRGT